MLLLEFPQNPIPFRGQRNQHLTPIPSFPFPAHIPRYREAIQQFHGAVMFNLQSFRDFSNVRSYSRRQSFDGQKHLVLARLQAQLAGSHLSGMHVAANLVAYFSQVLKLHQGERTALHAPDYKRGFVLFRTVNISFSCCFRV